MAQQQEIEYSAPQRPSSPIIIDVPADASPEELEVADISTFIAERELAMQHEARDLTPEQFHAQRTALHSELAELHERRDTLTRQAMQQRLQNALNHTEKPNQGENQ